MWQCVVVAGNLILAVALVVALVRVVPSPAFAPLKLLAVVYTDIFRGVPTLLVIFLVCFGLPALQLQGVPTDIFWLGTIALDVVVRRVCRGGDPVGHRLRAPEPVGGGAFARSVLSSRHTTCSRTGPCSTT